MSHQVESSLLRARGRLHFLAGESHYPSGGGHILHRVWRQAKKVRRARKKRELQRRISEGMAGQESWFFTLTRSRDQNLWLRPINWHLLATHMRRRWPAFSFCTVYEWRDERGAHLHVVVNGTPGLSEAWITHVVKGLGESSKVGGFKVVDNPRGLSLYLVKQVANTRVVEGWPRYFRPVSFSRNWGRSVDVDSN
jgi:hypothetical protein